MKKFGYSFLVVLTLSIALALPAAHAEPGFSAADLRGPFGFAFDGFFGAAPAAAVGQFTADGQGNLTGGTRTLVIGGAASTQTFNCTYTVDPDGTGSATCTVTGGPVPVETFDFVIVDKARAAHFVGTTSGATIRGVAKPQ